MTDDEWKHSGIAFAAFKRKDRNGPVLVDDRDSSSRCTYSIIAESDNDGEDGIVVFPLLRCRSLYGWGQISLKPMRLFSASSQGG